jgi:AcrR family transcriptional regulator
MEAAPKEPTKTPRLPLSRERVLRAAVELADERGIESLTMRSLGQELGVEAMSLYNHVANKDAILDGAVELVIGEVLEAVEGTEALSGPAEWKPATRRRILAAREVMLRHPWAPKVLESRGELSAVVLRYYDGLLGLMFEGGFSADLAHHAMHALGSRALGFTQELYEEDDDVPAETVSLMAQQMAAQYPNLAEMLKVVTHDADTTLGWCDDQFEFEFGLDLLLDGLERQRDAGA